MINVILNNEEYTLVDVYDYSEEKIYHYKSDEDDLFYIQRNDKLYLIKDDDVIEDIKDEFDLNPPEFLFSAATITYQAIGVKNCEILSEEEKNNRINLFIERLKSVKGLKVDFERIKSKLNKVNIYEGNVPPSVAGAFYHPATNNVVMGRNNNEELRFHELVHATSGRKFCVFQQTGFVEGMTDSLTERVFSNGKSSINNGIKFNFSNKGASYTLQIAIIRQMEEALGELSCDSVLNGDDEFFKKFGEKYGKDLLRYLGHRTTRLIKMDNHNSLKTADYFKETQNELMTRVFSRDFQNLGSIEEMQEYFEKLDRFQLVRGRYKKDSVFKVFYERKYQEAVAMLKRANLTPEEIEDALGQYKFKLRDFNAYRTIDEVDKALESVVPKTIADIVGNNVDISNVRCFKHYDELNNVSISMIVLDGEFISVIIGSLEKNTQYYKNHFKSKGITVNNSDGNYTLVYNGNSYGMQEVSIDINRIKENYDEIVNKKNMAEIKKAESEAYSVNEMLNESSKQLSDSDSKMVVLNNYLNDYSIRVTKMFGEARIDLKVNFGINMTNLTSSNNEILEYIKNVIGSTTIKYDKNKQLIVNLNDTMKMLKQIYNELNKERINNISEGKQVSK